MLITKAYYFIKKYPQVYVLTQLFINTHTLILIHTHTYINTHTQWDDKQSTHTLLKHRSIRWAQKGLLKQLLPRQMKNVFYKIFTNTIKQSLDAYLSNRKIKRLMQTTTPSVNTSEASLPEASHPNSTQNK